MKNIIVLVLAMILCGCSLFKDEYSDYEHYDLNKYNYKKFIYSRKNGNDTYDTDVEENAIAVLGDVDEGLFYKVGYDDYILLDEFHGTIDEYDKDEWTLFYKDKIYVLRQSEVFEYTLNKENTVKKIFNLNEKDLFDKYTTGEYFKYIYGLIIDKVDDNYLYLSNGSIRNVDDLVLNLKCSLESYECVEDN